MSLVWTDERSGTVDLQSKNFGAPDEVRPMADKGRVELVKVAVCLPKTPPKACAATSIAGCCGFTTSPGAALRTRTSV